MFRNDELLSASVTEETLSIVSEPCTDVPLTKLRLKNPGKYNIWTLFAVNKQWHDENFKLLPNVFKSFGILEINSQFLKNRITNMLGDEETEIIKKLSLLYAISLENYLLVPILDIKGKSISLVGMTMNRKYLGEYKHSILEEGSVMDNMSNRHVSNFKYIYTYGKWIGTSDHDTAASTEAKYANIKKKFEDQFVNLWAHFDLGGDL